MKIEGKPIDITNESVITGLVDRICDLGYVVVNDVFDHGYCESIIAKFNNCVGTRQKKGVYWGNHENEVLDNYFMDDPGLLELIYQPLTDLLMRRLIDDDYVLISPSARNRQIKKQAPQGNKASGVGWHTDSRFLQGGTGIRPSLCYMTVLMMDSFGADNGATHVIPGSHHRYQKPKDRDFEPLSFERMTGSKGSMAIFDTALWHRVGPPSQGSRWGVFNTYGPWFLKPYHRFPEMLNPEQIKFLKPIERQLLHLDSTPPLSHLESMITLARVRKAVEKPAS